ncbi:MAG: hypothetical protein ACI90V_006635 [Bacillariaceae sp.]|jgi:hypothetical protein
MSSPLPPSNNNMNVDDDDSFSSDSDDEFLTLRGDGKDVDREALVRKKLLESFYGKTSVDDDGGDDDSDSSSDDDSGPRGRLSDDALNSTDEDDDDDFDGNIGNVSRRSIARRRTRHRSSRGSVPRIPDGDGNTDDLDSTHFDAAKHTERYVLHSNVHPLLEEEEMLACQVRTLDSSMQTLVYENYSRFIEATDAVRNIGVNVQCNAGNLKKLSASVIVAGETARDVETNCGKLRDSVVEKLRTKRLLQRLESLLKLPKTLSENIDAGRYRWATKSYLTAYAILNKQSDGFESLQRIEEECYTIMEVLLEGVKNKLIHWSGNSIAGEDEEVLVNDNDDDDDDHDHSHDKNMENRDLTTLSASRSSLSMDDPPDPPETVAGIFECAGTPVLILNHQKQHLWSKLKNPNKANTSPTSAAGRRASQVDFKTGLSAEQCQEMSLDACLRLLERFLDTHHIELQEAMFTSSSSVDNISNDKVAPGSSDDDGGGGGGGGKNRLIPTNVLDSILEASALYSVTFPTENGQCSERLTQFVSTAFYSFLQHVRGGLLEQSTQTAYPKDLQRSISNGGDSTNKFDGGNSIRSLAVTREDSHNDSANDIVDDDEGQDSEDKAYEHVANATALLLESVQQFSSGLALPEVAIDEELASSLVDQTLELSEAMVRRRVDQKFFILRFRVIQNCLAPFCRNALLRESTSTDGDVTEKEESVRERIDRVVQMASVALSDSSQLVDDTVRSILSNNSNATPTLKTAVEQSTARFAVWLAAAMETLAGCESSEPKYVLDVMPEVSEDGDDIGAKTETTSTNLIYPISLDSYGNADNDLTELVENCMGELLEELDGLGTKPAKSDLTLAIAEMCRLAERSVMDDINQSIATHTGSINKHRSAQAGLFATALDGEASSDTTKNPTSMRFRLAASRVLTLYALNRGNEGAELLSSNLFELSRDDVMEEEEEMTGPRVGTWSLLTVVKSTAFDCANLFGGPKRAGPIPEVLEDEYASLTAARQKQAFRSSLVVDVERMFEEKVVVYPHPFENFAFQRNLVVVLALKVAFKSLREDVRLVRFTNRGYRQLLIDVEFFKFMIPHYVKDEFLSDGSNTISVLESLLTEVTKNAKERCDSSAMLQDDCSEMNQARAVIRDFMATNGGEDGLVSQFTIADDGNHDED